MKVSLASPLCVLAASLLAPDVIASETKATSSALRGNSEVSDSVTEIEQHQEQKHRDLQLLPLLCAGISALIPGDVFCECAIVLGVEFQCGFGNAICFGGQESGYCATPIVSGQLSLTPLTTGFQFCASDATNGGQPVAGLCINFGGAFEGGSGSGSGSGGTGGGDDSEGRLANTLLEGPKGKVSLTSSTNPLPTPDISFCEAVVDEQDCTSCEICDNGQGYIFDCTNVDARMIQSTCTPFSVITSLNPNQPKVSFLPQLDAL